MVALWLAVGVQLAAANAALDKCRALDREFDTRAMPKPCQAAAEDATLAVPERVEALRRLAFAHILNGDEALAEPAFVKMLVFSPDAELPADAGPRFRELFAKARSRFQAEGQLQTSTPPPVPAGSGPVTVRVELTDKLGRVVGARVIARVTPLGAPAGKDGAAGSAGKDGPAVAAPLEERLARSELSPGLVRFTGTVPEPHEVPPGGATVSWQVVFDGWDGRPVAATPPVVGEHQRATALAAGGEDGGAGAPWPWIIGGSAGGLALIGGIVGGTVYCFTAGPCRTQEAFVRVQIRQEAP